MAKPKPKSQAEKDADLQKMLAAAATSNDMVDAGEAKAAAAEPAASLPPASTPVEPTTEVEQKGENVSAAPAPEPAPFTAGELIPAAAAVPAPTPIPDSTPEPAAVPPVGPADGPVPEPGPAPGPALEPGPLPNRAADPKKDPADEISTEPATAVEAAIEGAPMIYDVASLFEKSADKKTWVVRITEPHQEYLSLLGTVVGGGASIPEMVHNIIAQFIKAHDGELQKALQKKLRQRTGKKS